MKFPNNWSLYLSLNLFSHIPASDFTSYFFQLTPLSISALHPWTPSQLPSYCWFYLIFKLSHPLMAPLSSLFSLNANVNHDNHPRPPKSTSLTLSLAASYFFLMIVSGIMLICSSICTWNPVCLTLWKTLLGFWSAWELKSRKKVISSRHIINISADRLYISVYLSLVLHL